MQRNVCTRWNNKIKRKQSQATSHFTYAATASVCMYVNQRSHWKEYVSVLNGCVISINHVSIFRTTIIAPTIKNGWRGRNGTGLGIEGKVFELEHIRRNRIGRRAYGTIVWTYLVGTISLPSTTNSHEVILIGHAIWPKLSRTSVSHDEYGVCESECKRSERCKRARLLGDALDIGDVDVFIWSICAYLVWRTVTQGNPVGSFLSASLPRTLFLQRNRALGSFQSELFHDIRLNPLHFAAQIYCIGRLTSVLWPIGMPNDSVEETKKKTYETE